MSTKKYIIGFVLSLLLSFAAYWLVATHIASGHTTPTHAAIIPALFVFALAQCVVQLVYFLHLSGARAKREQLIALCSTGVVIFILVAGSLWIMATLNQRMMPDTAHMEEYMHKQQGI